MADTRELRIAPVMTGGTSLAVWMGGVTAELYTMLRSAPTAAAPSPTDSVYTRLLRLTQTTPVVDVITGTSAGGLSGVLLAAAWRLGISPKAFGTLRDTWMQVADLGLVMRSPRDPNPTSLLRGDDYFVPNVLGLLQQWIRDPSATPSDAPIDLVTTVTTLTPEPKHRTDHFGESIDEVSHAQSLRFRKKDFEDATTWPKKLAVAARSSASIPGVFEPSFLSVGGAPSDDRPNFTDNASFSASRWVVDGGVVVNLPLAEALDRIFERRADDDVRRVVLYVSPTPDAATPAAPDDVDVEPSLREALLSVVLAPRAEGIATDIDALARQNAAVERQARTRSLLEPTVKILAADNAKEKAAAGPVRALLFDLYKDQRTQASVDATLGGIQRHLGAMGSAIDPNLRGALVRHRADLYPGDPSQFNRGDQVWGWGIRPVEQAVSIAVRLLNRIRMLPGPISGSQRQAMRKAQNGFHAALDVVNEVRDLDAEFWQDRFKALAELGPKPPEERLDTWAVKSYDTWPVRDEDGDQRPASSPAFQKLFDAHREVASHLLVVSPILRARVLEVATTATSATKEAGVLLLGELAALGFDDLYDPTVETVQRRLLALHLAQTVVIGDIVDREQPAELMQVSYNSRNFLDPDRSPQDKLAGPELARLGAFLKPSWRANDWLWGRMDGAYRLVLLLADPKRIRSVYATVELALAAVQVACALEPGEVLPPAISEEILGLYEHGPSTIGTLPNLVARLTEQVQKTIACEELPNVARAVEDSRGNEVESRRFKKAFDDAVDGTGKVEPAQAAALVQQMHIGTETVRTELGFPALNRLVTRAASVAVNGLTGTHSGIPVVSRLLRPARGPLQAVASLVSVMVGDSPFARAATAFVLAVCGAIVSLRIAGVDVPAGTFVISATLLTLVVFAAMFRSGAVGLALFLLVGAAIVGLSLAGPDVAEIVYDAPLVGHEPIGATSTATFDRETSIRVSVGASPDRGVTDITIPAGAKLEFNDAGSLDTPTGTRGAADWKRWGFTARPVSAFSAITFAVGGLFLLRTALRRRSFGSGHITARVVLGAGLIAAAIYSADAFDAVLTGPETALGWKHQLVDLATRLSGYGLEITLLVVVGSSLALAFGTDLVFSRLGRRAMTSVRKTWRAGVDELDKSLRPTG